MPLPEPILDDLRFQRDIVDEARRRIIRYCPEWTEYNLSDPGITLIELFAWMTEMITYRVNLVPEKSRVRFMELLGVQLQPATSARTELTFRLSTPFPISPDDETEAVIPQGIEVATRRTEEEPEIIFTTDTTLTVIPPRLVQLRRAEDFNKNYLPRLGVEVFHAFNQRRPQSGDTFYLGFDDSRDLSGHIIRLSFQVEETQATGVKRLDPPLVWECSVGNGQWYEVLPSNRTDEKDTTGGLNNPEGSIAFYLPLDFKPDQVHGRSAYWLRCRLEQRRKEQGMYSQSPRITNVTAQALGATVRATHALNVYGEELGRSEGEPAQAFKLNNAPVLELDDGETVEVEEKRDGELVYIPWTCVVDFSKSDRHDRHFMIDYASGEVLFGPNVRQRDGTTFQYGRVPEANHIVRFSKYRHGGGAVGNVPAGKLQQLRSAIPYVDQVTNVKRAEGGRDPEDIEEAKLRARREVRSQQRAVTAEDYEDLAIQASRVVARVRCISPDKSAGLPPGMVEVLVVPAVFESVRLRDYAKLALDEELVKTVERHLDKYRLLTTTLRIREPNYLGIKVNAEIVVSEYSDPDTVRARVSESLSSFLAPLAAAPAAANGQDELLGPGWKGWPFGRALFTSELYTLIQRVPGVKHVLEVKLSQRPVVPGKEMPLKDEEEATVTPTGDVEAPVLTPVEGRRLDVSPDTLLCSLEHEIALVEL
jgi:predicted phage baseplate assembly protein